MNSSDELKVEVLNLFFLRYSSFYSRLIQLTSLLLLGTFQPHLLHKFAILRNLFFVVSFNVVAMVIAAE